MAMSEKYSVGAVVLDDTADVVIGGITQSSVSQNVTVESEATSGEVYARIMTIKAIEPSASFTTRMVSTALTNIGVSGLSIVTLASGVALFLNQHAIGSTRAAGSTHRKVLGASGLVVPRRLTLGLKGDAELSYDVIYLSADGSAAPVAVTDNNAFPTVTDAERYALGTAKIGNVALGQLTQLDIDFGINAVVEQAGGEAYPTFVSIESIKPSITIGCNKASDATTALLAGTEGTHANSIIFLRKRDDGGTFVADVTAEHIKFTAAGIAHLEQVWTASNQGAATVGIRMDLKYDGTNAPITFTGSTAIT